MNATFSLFPKFYKHLSAEQLAELVREVGLDTTNLVVREGYWADPYNLAADRSETAFARLTFLSSHPLYVIVSNDWDDPDNTATALALQEELTSTENKISYARQFYNDAVMTYNVKVQKIPANIVAGMCSFRREEFFEIEDAAEREAPVVEF